MNSAKHFLVGRTEDDIDVRYPFYWAETVINESGNLGVIAIDLKNENFTRVNFENSIKQYNPFFVFNNGHGEECSSCGHGREIVIQVGLNEVILKGKIAYFVSCECGGGLGRSLIDHGCRSFIGYKEEFAFPTNDLENPLEDDAARGFMEASNEVALSILKGDKPTDAWKKSQKKFDEWVGIWSKQKRTDNISQIIGGATQKQSNPRGPFNNY